MIWNMERFFTQEKMKIFEKQQMTTVKKPIVKQYPNVDHFLNQLIIMNISHRDSQFGSSIIPETDIRLLRNTRVLN